MADTVSEIDMILPDDQLRSEIEKQLSTAEPVYTFSKNFLELFYIRWQLKNEARQSEDNENDADAVDNNETDIEWLYRDVILNLKQRCGILVDTEGQVFDPKVINTIYSVFVYRLHKNIVDFIVASILRNKETFIQQFTDIETGNLSFKNARKTFVNKTDAIIAVKFGDIIDSILNDDNMINPENIIDMLYKLNPEDYEYREIANLFNIVYLGFDIPTFCQYIRNAYIDVVSLENLKIQVIERLLPSFKRKEQGDAE